MCTGETSNARFSRRVAGSECRSTRGEPGAHRPDVRQADLHSPGVLLRGVAGQSGFARAYRPELLPWSARCPHPRSPTQKSFTADSLIRKP